MTLIEIKISAICVICVPFHSWWCAAAHEISLENRTLINADGADEDKNQRNASTPLNTSLRHAATVLSTSLRPFSFVVVCRRS
jgi:hypothetical protein